MGKLQTRIYAESIAQVLDAVQGDRKGLSVAEAEKRLSEDGKNALPKADNLSSRLHILASQFKSTLMIILIAAGAVSGALGEITDMVVIFITAGFNVVIGYLQENKANNALKKLRELVQYKVLVKRDGKKRLVDSEDVVVGDVIYLEAGDRIQADGRIIESVEFLVNEAPLTGESEPIQKTSEALPDEKIPVGDRTNMVFSGTTVTEGRAVVVVTAIGTKTEIGKIASLVKETEDERTPLQKQLESMSKKIGIGVFFLSVFVFVLGFLVAKGEDRSFVHLFETAIAIAVAAIPEGLVISLTVILAIGMRFILKRKALVRKLVAAETLGSVSVICTDKTGTITEGKMKVARVVTADHEIGYNDLVALEPAQHSEYADVFMAVRAGVLANDGVLQNPDARADEWVFVGDTTDTAIIEVGSRIGLNKEHVEDLFPRLDEVAFTSERKFMATCNSVNDGYEVFAKGAPEMMYERSTHIHINGEIKKFTPAQRKKIIAAQEELTSQGLRVLAVAKKEYSEKSIKEENVSDLVFIGLIALADPLRRDVADTLDLAARAGIRTVMITGDHVKTAQSIAKQLGLPHDDDAIFDGNMLSSINDDELQQAVKHVHIFARVDPVHKIRIVRAFQANGEVVAMTGDGVNDAPAIKGADIGVALGSGTAVAKETADMVLLNDAFSTIVAAVKEGRTIYQNIKKVVLYLLSGSFAEVVMVTASMLAGYPIAALPAQILWINLVEDAFPNMALAFDKGEDENMNDKPRKKDESIIDKEMKSMIILKSILANVLLFIIFVYFWKTTNDIKLTRTIVFVGFGIDALFYIFSIRSLRKMIWRINPFSNMYLIAAVAFGWVMLLLAIYWSPLQALLRTVPLTANHWVLMIGFGLCNVVIIETVKAFFIYRRKLITT